MPDLIDVAEAEARINSLIQPSAEETVPLSMAKGRILREPVIADRDLPPFNRVMMDGYALRYKESCQGTAFQIAGTALAGDATQILPPGDQVAMEVMTGAPLPEGADTVVPFEDTEREGDALHITDSECEKGQFIHRKGSDFPEGTQLLSPGVRLRSVELGIAASCGAATLKVCRQLVVSVFGTGDELVPVDVAPAPHQIRRSNALAVASVLSAAGATVQTCGHLSDAVETQRDGLAEAIANSDLVVISGAVSKGRLDWIPGFLDELGECHFHGVRQRPGKPMGVWKAKSGALIFALPGNPVSTLVCTHRYVLPYVASCSGLPSIRTDVTLRDSFSFDRPLTLFLPVKIVGASEATPAPVNNSGDYASLAGSDGFIELPSTENHWTAGTSAPFTPWI